MKENLIRLLIIAPVVLVGLGAIRFERSRHLAPLVLGSSVVFTVGDTGIICNSKAFLSNQQNGQLQEIDGSTVKGAPLGAVVVYQTQCQNSGSTDLSNIGLTNNLSGQNQNYVTYKSTTETDCAYQNSTFSCVVASLPVGGTFTRRFSVDVVTEVPTTSIVTNNTLIDAGQGLSGNTQNEFSIYPRPVCNSLGPGQNPLIVVENIPQTLTAQGTTYDGSAPRFSLSFGDGSPDATGTNNNFIHAYTRVSGETESTYFTYLKVSDSLGNTTGDAANCSADCSKIVKVIGALATKYCTCSNGAPSCSSNFGTASCTGDVECSGSCDFFCDQAAQTVTPSTGKSPLSVSLSLAAGGSPAFPITFKVYDCQTLIKQEMVSSKTTTVTLNLTNNTQAVETHLLITNITDNTGKTTPNNCVNSVAVQPGGSGRYGCQNNRCVYLAEAGTNSCQSDSDCVLALGCALTAVPAAGNAPLTTALTASCQGGTPPYISYQFYFDDSQKQASAVNVVNHTYQVVGSYAPSVVGTDSLLRTSPPARAQVLVSSTSATPSDFHLECNATSKTCEAVLGIGTDTCQSNLDCQKSSGPAHFVCNKIRKTCESYYGSGPNSCGKNADCQRFNNGYNLPTLLTIILGSSLLVGGLMIIIKRS